MKLIDRLLEYFDTGQDNTANIRIHGKMIAVLRDGDGNIKEIRECEL